jgi:hypothetical protein
MKVGVVGLGFVGSGMRKLFGQSHQVAGYDPVCCFLRQERFGWSGGYVHLRSDANGARWRGGHLHR